MLETFTFHDHVYSVYVYSRVPILQDKILYLRLDICQYLGFHPSVKRIMKFAKKKKEAN